MRNTNLHKIIITGMLSIFGFISFSNGGFFPDSNSITSTIDANSSINVNSYTCVKIGTATCFENARFIENGSTQNGRNQTNGMYCFVNSGTYTNLKSSQCTYVLYDFSVYSGNSSCPECQECQECPEIDTGSILSGNCDTNYCVQNDLCPVPSNFSQLFINDIEHQSAPLIKVTIPEEIERDSNVDSGEFNLDIVGYGYDQDKMQSMVNTQYYKPTPEEMSGLIEKIADFLPLIAIALLIIRIRRVLKKVFRF